MSEKLSEMLEALCAIKGRSFTVAERAESLILMSRAAAALRAVEGDALDAERYRWIREEAARYKGDDDPGRLCVSITQLQRRRDGNGFTGLALPPEGESFDAAIDKARGVPLDAAGSAEGVGGG